MSELPILRYKTEIKKLLKRNKLVVIKGETGCGKTTQVPQIVNEIFFDKKKKKKEKKENGSKKKKKMLISLPRRVATITVAERVAKEMNRGNIGNYVGYTIRFQNVCSKETRIKFVTDGILIREIMNDPLLKKYKFLILDEIHERSIRTDVLLGYAKILLQKRKKLKIILMSATFDINTFNHFLDNPPIISIPHKLHKITIFYPQKPIEDYLLSTVSTILQIHFGNAKIKSEGSTYYEYEDAGELKCPNSQLHAEREIREEDKPGDGNDGGENYPTCGKKNGKKRSRIGDILVFLPGQEEIEIVNAMLKEKLKIIYKGTLLKRLINHGDRSKDGITVSKGNVTLNEINSSITSGGQPVDSICFHFGETEIIPDKIYNMKILQLYSSLPNKKQKIVFEPVPANTRKVILSTNVAETSVTIPNIKYVVDSGKVKIKFFDEKRGSSVLKITHISKDSAVQRSGRAGREAPGQVYRMYTKEEYEKMNPFLIPEIFRSDLTQIYLELKFDFPENPKKEVFVHAARILFKINAIDINNDLTELGKKLCLLPLSPIYANMLLCSVQFQCIDEIATIVAMLSCDSIFLNYNFYEDMNEKDVADDKRGDRSKGEENNDEMGEEGEDEEGKKINDRNKLINVARRKLVHPDGDHLTLLHIFYLWKEEISNNEKKNFCHMYALNSEVLIQVEKVKMQLLEIMKNKMGIPISKRLHMHKWDQILICLCKSCFFNVAKSTANTNVFLNLVNKTKVRIHPSSTLFNSFTKPTFIFYSDVIQTKRLYARIVTKIEADWLLKHVSQNFQLIKP
ncbi:ATP-dependent RNA helicase DHX36, putative [Plasmodium ovale]|uniref:ATP-dependent RNA helicase DHX36, putative n=1 Tax=Plasmodium ovale TaxID=36330 RepID=A0A1D3KXV0_PLAOA|nr:ATP-dependent RNA helicase DHX36, putative [Plasmodium ovale]